MKILIQKAKLKILLKKLLLNDIVVDCILLNNKEDNKMLCAISHITGGLSLRPKNTIEGLSFIENESFINFSIRRCLNRPLIPRSKSILLRYVRDGIITIDFMNQLKENLIMILN